MAVLEVGRRVVRIEGKEEGLEEVLKAKVAEALRAENYN